MANSQVKPKTFFKQIISIASKYVENHDSLMTQLVDRNKGVYALRNIDHPIIMDDAPQFYLLQVKNSNGLFIHICVTLKPPYPGAAQDINHEFEGVSIHFLQGTRKLFCRAEWDVKKEKEKLLHPQPHWHWGYEKEGTIDRFDTSKMVNIPFLEDNEGEGTATSSLPAVDFKELHYAMASKWVSQDSAIEEFKPQNLYNWMKLCLGNVIDQYNYQVNKGNFKSSFSW